MAFYKLRQVFCKFDELQTAVYDIPDDAVGVTININNYNLEVEVRYLEPIKGDVDGIVKAAKH